MLSDEIDKREKATQKQVGEQIVFSPMTSKKKFNFFFFFNIEQQEQYRTIYSSSKIWTNSFKFFQTNGIGDCLTFWSINNSERPLMLWWIGFCRGVKLDFYWRELGFVQFVGVNCFLLMWIAWVFMLSWILVLCVNDTYLPLDVLTSKKKNFCSNIT